MKQFEIQNFRTIISEVCATIDAPIDATEEARRRADDMARRMTDGTYKLPFIGYFYEAVLEEKGRINGPDLL